VASIARAFRLLDSGAEEKAGKQLVIGEGRIEFRDIHFSYTADREVLKGLSFVLQPGRSTALVGGSGAGKTTTIDLLLKLYEPVSGSIFIDGQDLTDLDAASIRRQIGVVSTDGAIFRGTLADNIRYKRPDATDEEVVQAVLASGLQTTLQRLPQGLETLVGESGMGLSVGERQRIQIARALVAKPRILVLDEATANLDYATESEIKKTIESIRLSTTVIIIAHRYSMVRDADRVIVLAEGQVQEEGTPVQLLDNGGWFSSWAQAVETGAAGVLPEGDLSEDEDDKSDEDGLDEDDPDENSAEEDGPEEDDPADEEEF
jgi:ABC-type multidrug transport system fused ATPase/permease subunit